jgi:signal transduction histidine kinase
MPFNGENPPVAPIHTPTIRAPQARARANHSLPPRAATDVPMVLLIAAVWMRSLIAFRDVPAFPAVLLVLGLWTGLFALELAASHRWPGTTVALVALQSALIVYLMSGLRLDGFDFFAILFAVLSMRLMTHRSPRQAAIGMTAFVVLLGIPLLMRYGLVEGLGFTLVYMAVNVFFGFYALATLRAVEARARNRRLAQAIEEANLKLRDDTAQREQLAAARARNQLARELHDSVTQTVFSMTLATESALMLLEREPQRAAAQLDHLTRLAQNALSQMQTLISELRPEAQTSLGLIPALRRHLAERLLPETLHVSLHVEGGQSLAPSEELGLFAIAREAINNIVKHARATQAVIRLHLEHPFWMEVTDNGEGFIPDAQSGQGGMGLVGMREQASEIGWKLEVSSVPGAGTRVLVSQPGQETEPS